ncbi:uncharacterized protein SPPG_02339 [Spizellomyces punctatus DAOM BR117]|uniref:Eukaryotic translation initiation factor 3 subunit M n=1 Tax=Spizellomyces punctatus (strain DAOM BR117) TaxID=645134 RepID=A0A0L0HQR4_SPIPD|nr:uncharacterized protein SPPG_02339 [Spizellomyces punctatus DAOM BR117]KND03290.1 hypothetical protein SPPG_02339 [Spizellomyces punctatus DAOM BR117]|eukprot:XP_016611329.1 hypothetical protein SPPG_02339 [Spizellomyces punctatus DAOM BR117]
MSSASVAFFSGDQSALELANYIGVAKGEQAETGAFFQSTKQLLSEEKYTEVLTKFANESAALLEATEKDFEPLYNLLIALIKDAQPEIVPKLVNSIIQPIVASGTDKANLRLKVLSNLYNNLESNSPVRYDVFVAILNVAAETGELDVLVPHLLSLDAWIAEWGVALNQRRALYLLISQKLEQSGEYTREAYEFLLKYLATFDNGDAKSLQEAKDAAIRAVKEAFRIPTVLDFEDLFKLQAVQALKPSKLFDLLKIFLDESLKQYQEFVKANPGFIDEHGLSEEDNLTKMRLLSMASLAAANVQGEVAYDTIAQTLDVPEDEVEIWVINVIRAGLMDAKMNQLKRTVVVGRSVHRVFSETEWQQLNDKLNAWKANLKDVLQVISNAKLIAGSQGATIETVITA